MSNFEKYRLTYKIIEKTVYECLLCKKEFVSLYSVESHITEHEYKDLVTETKFFGNSCYLKSEDQAKAFKRLYSLSHNQSPYGDYYHIEIVWSGSGSYLSSGFKIEKEYYESGDKDYIMTFIKSLF